MRLKRKHLLVVIAVLILVGAGFFVRRANERRAASIEKDVPSDAGVDVALESSATSDGGNFW